MTITQAIAELLKRDKSVAIPHFGTLTSTSLPAKINVITNHFTPPCSKIEFITDSTIQDDTLANYLSKNKNISIEEAEQRIAEFVNYCKSEFDSYNKIYFEDLGQLARKYDGNYEFELNDGINLNEDAFGLPEFHQNPILRNVVKDNDTDNDNDDDQNADNDHNDDQKEVESVEGGQATLLQQNQQPEDEGKKDEDKSGNNVEKTETQQDDTDNKTNEEKESNDTKSVKPEPEEKKHRKWPWILLLLLIVLCAGFVALTYFELIPNYIPEIIKPKPTTHYVIGGVPRPQYYYEYTEPEDTTTYLLPYPEAQKKFNDSIQRIADSIAIADSIVIDTATIFGATTPTDTITNSDTTAIEKTEVGNETTTPEPVVEPAKPEPKQFIVCGCFSMEENAEKKASQLREEGYPNAFVKKRGSMWNVYYNEGYTDKQEAKQALDEIRTDVNPKAWLLEMKK